MKVHDTARLHHKTVSEHQQHIVRKARKPGMKQAIESMKVDQRVWKTAMRLAKGDATRIVVRSETEVVVVNQSKKKR